MSLPSITVLTATAAALGPASHFLFWMRYDFTLVSHIIFIVAVSFPVIATVLLNSQGTSLIEAWKLSVLAQSCYCATLACSILLYRAFLHPTRIYPGPWGAKISTLWRASAFVKSDFRGYKVVDDLHQELGEVVRIGSNYLSINHVDAIAAIYGPQSQCTRFAWNEALRKQIQSLHNKAEHKARRHVWEQGLNARVCQEYLPRINALTDILISRLSKIAEQSQITAINRFCRFYTFDVMGDLGFGRSYNQLATDRGFAALTKIENFLSVGQIMIQIPWLCNLASYIPGVEDPMAELRKWADKLLADRDSNPSQEKDIMSFIEEPSSVSSNYKITKDDLAEDTVTLQIAGADTSYSALVHLCYYLAHNTLLQYQIRTEVLSVIDETTSYPVWSKLSQLPLLDATINETLRMHPPVPQGPPRDSPSTPITIAGHFIPPNTIVSPPIWSLHHDPRYFEDPHTFRPERWLMSPELIKDRRAFIPFSTGPMNCVGRFLAIMEIKVFVARVIANFEISLAENEDGSDLLNKSRDYFTMWLPDLRVRLKAVEAPKEQA